MRKICLGIKKHMGECMLLSKGKLGEFNAMFDVHTIFRKRLTSIAISLLHGTKNDYLKSVQR